VGKFIKEADTMREPLGNSNTSRMSHKKMVKQVADYFVKKGLSDVRAKVDPYPEPNPLKDDTNGVKGYFPDITAYANRLLIVEVVSTELILDKKKNQWQFFNRYTSSHNGVFILAVPKSKTALIRNRLEGMGAHYNLWEI